MNRIIVVKACSSCPLCKMESPSKDHYCTNESPHRKITTTGIVSKWCSLPKEVIPAPKPYRNSRR